MRSLASALRPLALASLIANITLIVTGAAVRLTGSGLGCPTWPRCTDDSYTTTAEMGVHGMIEFGNRLLTFVLVGLAIATFAAAIAQRPRRKAVVWLSVAVGFAVPAQGVVGGITVLSGLNPWVVGLHFIVSIVMIAGCYALWRRAGEGGGDKIWHVPAPIRHLAWLTTAASFAVIAAGVVVTGSGPHAGDHGAARNGLDPTQISQVHADLVFLLIGLSVALWFALRATGAPATAVRAAAVLVIVEFSQGLIGFVQYFTHLPIILVGVHMLGSGLVWTSTLAVLWALRERPVVVAAPAGEPAPAKEPAAV
ncbi:COX15/CtaA family protein [Actinoplanes rectilineatus]|uniref:COX15/CtaA family protein n=1 Tax=Actinoplanes rectilineatus TaxID=113571 RepID=UPI000A898FCC|nr:COX15/CtaA family protein [Actinoplanes rectilineatus]